MRSKRFDLEQPGPLVAMATLKLYSSCMPGVPLIIRTLWGGVDATNI